MSEPRTAPFLQPRRAPEKDAAPEPETTLSTESSELVAELLFAAHDLAAGNVSADFAEPRPPSSSPSGPPVPEPHPNVEPYLAAGLSAENAKLISELLLAARNLAAANVLADLPRAAAICGPVVEHRCRECQMQAHLSTLKHLSSCLTGRVLRLIEEINAAVENPFRKEPEVQPVRPVRAEMGKSPRGLFNEPWVAVTEDRRDLAVDCLNRTVAQMYGEPPYSREILGRMVMCVNFCEGIPSRLLEDQQPMTSVLGTIDRQIAAGRVLNMGGLQ